MVYVVHIIRIDRLTFSTSPVIPRFKPTNPSQGLFLPVYLNRQLQEGTFEFAINHIISKELELSHLDKRNLEH